MKRRPNPKGSTGSRDGRVRTVPDRREAIRAAVTLAGPDDIVLVAGKGHENYQEIRGVKAPFDDKLVLTEIFLELNK